MKDAVHLRVAAALDLASRPLIGVGIWVGRMTSWLILAVIAAVLLTVVMNALGMNELLRWNERVFLFGRAFTINSATELQWYLYGLLVLFASTYALHTNAHVRVDLLYHRFSPRTRHLVDLTGHLVLLIPFCLLVAYLYWPQVMMSYNSGEQSNFGGLTDRFLIKGALSVSLVFMALGAFGRVLQSLAAVLDPQRAARESFHVR
ncbi:TRAP transporter small permease subunit [Marinospirillum alkaliphilum]|uniref:TRAP transporter small permease protein n=1 Tax=Marinospirillum alkaliphilum DSM 21637 TaxID=1122209 RepID=A0A1K1XX73_9GAMM|nr:TRAP transporter small permease subunit [Marinospirillum alkaliphilum]SFX54086.1 TRAP-type mannitol/chloroaromatic compound transport system, small permease component [Marinospirillum alkaliphilum DSM 21637]